MAVTALGILCIVRFGVRTENETSEEAAASSVSDYGSFDYGSLDPVKSRSVQILDQKAFDKIRNKCREVDFDPDALMLAGSPVPCDEKSATFYVPQDMDGADTVQHMDGDLAAEDGDGTLYILSDEKLDQLPSAISEGYAFTCMVVQGRSCFSAKLVFTGLPAVTIRYEGEEPTRQKEVHEGSFVLDDPQDGKVVSTPCTFHVRGNTSSLFPKKSFKVSLVRQNGAAFKQSLLGMREDDDWILNAVYQDDTHIREKVAMDLWNEVNDLEETPVYTSHMEFVEVFFNNTYWGLYCLQEPVDRKQLDLQNGDILYKIKDWAQDHGKTLSPCVREDDFEKAAGTDELDSSDGWLHAQVKFPKSGLPNDVWDPFHTYFDFVYNDLSYETLEKKGVTINWDNAAVYHLFCLLTNAEDNIWKNAYVAAERSGSGFTIRTDIWDLNYTFGNVFYYLGSSTDMSTRYMKFDESTQTEIRHAYNLTYAYEALERSDSGRADSLLKTKYAAWRDSGISAESLCRAAQDCLSEMNESGALSREERRWPGCDTADGVSDMEEWIRARVNYLDRYFGYGGS